MSAGGGGRGEGGGVRKESTGRCWARKDMESEVTAGGGREGGGGLERRWGVK